MRIASVQAVLLAALLLPESVLAAEKVPLRVDMGGIELDAPFPVRSGVPLARGALKSAENARIVREGREIESQARAIATWPDGSVKWLLVDFLARDGDAADLEYGGRIRRRRVRNAIKATKTAAAVTVDTGVVRIAVRRDGTGFIDELAFDQDGNGRYDAGETVIGPAGQGERRNFLDFVHRPASKHYRTWGNHVLGGKAGRSTVAITALELEEEGPLHAVILIRGKHMVPGLASRIADQIKYEGQSDFTVRIHAYKDSGIVTAESTFVFDGVADDDFLKAWGVSLEVGKGMTFATPVTGPGAMGDGMARATPAGDAPLAALTQSSADSYAVWSGDADRLGQTVVASGDRSRGWVDLAGDGWGLTVGTRWFWKRWPNAIHYDAASGRLSVMLYPPETNLCDFRNYTRLEWGVGETGGPAQDIHVIAPFLAKGTANTKEIMLVFHRGAVDRQKTSRVYDAFENLPLAKASPEHYASTRALGYWAPKAEGKHPGYEKGVESAIRRWVDGQKQFRWYGMWDYGDYQQRFGGRQYHKHGRWENDWGRWGWGHGDGHGRIDRSLLMEFLRTGDRLYFEQGEAMNRHRTDADMCESREVCWDWSVTRKIPSERTKGPWWDLRGCAHRHGVLHWSGPYLGARGGCPMGHRIHYYLTGNGRCGDMLDIVAEMGMTKYGWGGYERVAQRFGHSGGADGLGTGLQGILVAWERTGDAKYGEAIKAAFSDKSCGAYRYMHPKGSWNTGMTTAFGTFQALEEYADLTGNELAKQILIDNAKMVRDDTKMHTSWMWPGSFIPIVAAAYRFTGDESLGTLLKDMIGKQVGKGVGGGNAAPAIAYAIESLKIHGDK